MKQHLAAVLRLFVSVLVSSPLGLGLGLALGSLHYKPTLYLFSIILTHPAMSWFAPLDSVISTFYLKNKTPMSKTGNYTKNKNTKSPRTPHFLFFGKSTAVHTQMDPSSPIIYYLVRHTTKASWKHFLEYLIFNLNQFSIININHSCSSFLACYQCHYCCCWLLL